MSGFPEYDKRSRFPKRQAKGICRGCRLPIDPMKEPRAQTWHHACKKKFEPVFVKHAVRERSGGKCELCGKDCSHKAQWNHKVIKPKEPHYYHECSIPYPFDAIAYYAHPLWKEYQAALLEWKRLAPKPEYDHIIPHCEGGLFVVENIRLICVSCHRARTKLWHASRAKSTTP